MSGHHSMTPKNVLTTAAVALVVVVAYEKYSTGKLPKIGR